MASTTFVDRQTPIVAAWLNDANAVVYGAHYVTDAVFNGVTDDSAAIQAAINEVFIAGGGNIVITGPCAIGTTIKLKSKVSLTFTPKAYFKWIGSTSGTCVETDSTTVVQDFSLYDFKLDTGASFTGTALYFHSAHNIYSNRITLITTGTTSTALKFIANSTGGETSLTKRNITACVFDLIIQQGTCGTFIEFDGVTLGYDGTPQVVTLNNFGTLFAESCGQYGINFKNWVDNNTFNGMTRLAINGDNTVGVKMGSGSSLGVYMNAFNLLAVDTFGTYINRVGMALDNSKLTKVNSFYQSPEAEGGVLTATSAATSYDVYHYKDSTSDIIHYRRLVTAASEGFTSSRVVSLANNTATSFNVAEGGTNENITFILTIASDDANANGVAWLKCRRSSGTAAITPMVSGSNFATTTGVLTGTTGTITKLTVSANNDGKFYIENRLGTTVKLSTHVAAWMTTP